MSYDAASATTSPIQDQVRIKAASLSGLPVFNDRSKTQPAVSTTSIVSTPLRDVDNNGTPETYGAGEKIQVRLNYTEAVTVDTAKGRPRLKIKMHANKGEKWAVYESGSGTTKLDFAYTVVSENSSSGGNPVTDTGIVVVGDSLELAGGVIRSASTELPAHPGHPALGQNANHKVDGSLDGAAPVLVEASLSIRALALTFDENLDVSSMPPGSSFCVTATSPQGSVRHLCGVTNASSDARSSRRVTLHVDEKAYFPDSRIRLAPNRRKRARCGRNRQYCR